MYQCITVHILIFMFGYRAMDWGAVDWVIIIFFSAMHCLDIGNCSGGTDGMSKMAASLLGWEWRDWKVSLPRQSCIQRMMIHDSLVYVYNSSIDKQHTPINPHRPAQ